MKAFAGFKAEAPARKEQLPAGGYIAKIMDAKEIGYDWGIVLLISFDIAEGEYKDFFAKDYRNQQQEDKKWRGTFRLRIPKDDGSEKDGWSKKSFNNAMWAVEASNTGYHWDWNEARLKGKTVGVLYRNKEWEMNGNTGWFTECCALTDAEEIRKGSFKMPKDKPLRKEPSSSGDSFIDIDASELGDLPF